MNLRPQLLKVIESGLSQSEVARRIGLTRSTVNTVVKSNKPWNPRYGAGAKLMALYKAISTVDQ